ncbi:MAG: murein L,D-transpeptidase, partial [Actinomycetospora chiangmaiensis]|nr:murein L,D-transpeptidase [Actinomycetospora chiangmaiensis]
DGPNGPGTTWGPIEIETGIADGERRDIKLVKPVPVTFVYLTGYATPDGKAHFRDDIYKLDVPASEPAATGAIPPATPGPAASPASLTTAKVAAGAPAVKPAAVARSAPKVSKPRPTAVRGSLESIEPIR